MSRSRTALRGLAIGGTLIMAAALLSAPKLAGAAEPGYFVAPDGTGQACTRSVPCALETAQGKIRSETATMTRDLVVNLAGGTYRRTEPWELSAAKGDGGTGDHRVIYQADRFGTDDQAEPVISGGTPVTGWSRVDGEQNLWRAPVGDLRTRQLYVNGRRAERAGQDTGIPGKITELTGMDGDTKTYLGYSTDDPAMRGWRNPDQVEFVYNGGAKDGNYQWAEPRCLVDKITHDGDATKIIMRQPCFQLTSSVRGGGMTFPTSIENAFELLDQPGEWYLDETEGQLYYQPRKGEDPTKADIVAPVLDDLVDGTGTASRPLRNVSFRGLTFAEAGYLDTSSDTGFPEDSLNLTIAKLAPGEEHLKFWSAGIKNLQVPAAVTMTLARGISFEGNTFTRLGAAGLTLDNGSQRNRVTGNVFTDISGQGVQVGNVDLAAESGPQVVTDNRIDNNYFADMATEYHGGYGIWIAAAARTTVTHNFLTDLPRGGIASNHVYSYGNSINHSHVITDNVITDWAKVILDGGGFDTNGPQNGPDGKQPNTLVARNVFAGATRGHGHIYLDFWSQGFTVENNVMYGGSYRSAMLRISGSGTPCCNRVLHNYGDKAIAWGHTDQPVDNIVLPVESMPASIMAGAGPESASFERIRRAARTAALDDLTLPAFPSTARVSAPTGVTVGKPEPGPEARLSWRKVTGATGYEVGCTAAGDEQETIMAAVTGDRTTTQLSGLRPGDRRRCVVRARHAGGAVSPPSTAVTVAIPGPAGLAGRWDFKGAGSVAADGSGAANPARLWRSVGHYEAEDGTGTGTCAGPLGGEYYPAHHGAATVSCFGPGARQSLRVSAPEAGSYTLDFRYAASREGAWDLDGSRTLSLYVNGVKTDQLRFAWTGSWASPDDLFHEVELAKGDNTVELRVDEGDLGWIAFDSLNVLRPDTGRTPGILPLDGSTTAWVGTQPALGFDHGGYTVAARFKSESQGRQRLVSKGFLRDNGTGYALLLDGGKLRFGVGSNWQGETREPWEKTLDLTTTAKFADGAWHQVAAVVDPATKTARIYVDGRPQQVIAKDGHCAVAADRSANIGNCPRIAATTYDPLIIGSYNASSDYATGAIDDVTVWGRALTPAEIAGLR